jgi:hypothetical protein
MVPPRALHCCVSTAVGRGSVAARGGADGRGAEVAGADDALGEESGGDAAGGDAAGGDAAGGSDSGGGGSGGDAAGAGTACWTVAGAFGGKAQPTQTNTAARQRARISRMLAPPLRFSKRSMQVNLCGKLVSSRWKRQVVSAMQPIQAKLRDN